MAARELGVTKKRLSLKFGFTAAATATTKQCGTDDERYSQMLADCKLGYDPVSYTHLTLPTSDLV